jgi:hypothetical protein
MEPDLFVPFLPSLCSVANDSGNESGAHNHFIQGEADLPQPGSPQAYPKPNEVRVSVCASQRLLWLQIDELIRRDTN